MIVQTDPRAPRVVLVGPPGAGKSTIGRKLARELGVELYDTDAGIERETGRSIPEIFATDGEPEFRKIEERVVRRAILAERGVVSLGGGAVLSKDTRALLRNRTVVYLEISVAEGLRRTGASNQRPLLNGADPGAKYRELMRKRRPLYREVATVRVRTDGRSPGRVVRMILAKLGMEPVAPSAEPEPDTTAQNPTPSGSNRSRARRRARARAAARRRAASAEQTGEQSERTDDATSGGRPRRARGRRRPENAPAVSAADSGPGAATGARSDGAATSLSDGGTPAGRSWLSRRSGGDATPSENSGGRPRRARRAAGAPSGTSSAEAAEAPPATARQWLPRRSPTASPDGDTTGSRSDSNDNRTAESGDRSSSSGRARRARARRGRAHAAEQPARTESEQRS